MADCCGLAILVYSRFCGNPRPSSCCARYLPMVIWKTPIRCIVCLRPAVHAETKLDGAVVHYCSDHFRRKLPTYSEVLREIRSRREIRTP